MSATPVASPRPGLQVLRRVPLEDLGAAIVGEAMALTRTPPLQAYYRAVGHTRSGLRDGVGQPLPGADPSAVLTFAESELVLVGLLAAQGGARNLALHLVIALAAGVPLSKIEHVLMITGLYGGIEKSSDALEILRATEDLLDELLGDLTPDAPLPDGLGGRLVRTVMERFSRV